MKTFTHEVEIEESKRFTTNKKSKVTVETFRASPKKRTATDGTDRVYNVYNGTAVECEPGDFSSIDAITALDARLKSDIYPDDTELKPLDTLVKLLNNGGLRLAYGEAIKDQYKIGGSTSVVKILLSYSQHLANTMAETGDVKPWKDFTAMSEDDKKAAAVKWANEVNSKV